MTYTTTNFKTKKQLKAAVAKGEKLTIFEPGLGQVVENGTVYLEGPHYPEPHRWYARAHITNGIIDQVS